MLFTLPEWWQWPWTFQNSPSVSLSLTILCCFSIELFALLIFSWKSYGKTSEPDDGPRTSGQHAGSIFVFLGIHICFFFPSTKSIKYSLSAYTLQGCQVKTELTHMPLFLRSSRVHQLLWRAQETNLHSEAHSPKAYLSWFAPPIPTLHFHYGFPNSCPASLMHSFSFSQSVGSVSCLRHCPSALYPVVASAIAWIWNTSQKFKSKQLRTQTGTVGNCANY